MKVLYSGKAWLGKSLANLLALSIWEKSLANEKIQPKGYNYK